MGTTSPRFGAALCAVSTTTHRATREKCQSHAHSSSVLADSSLNSMLTLPLCLLLCCYVAVAQVQCQEAEAFQRIPRRSSCLWPCPLCTRLVASDKSACDVSALQQGREVYAVSINISPS